MSARPASLGFLVAFEVRLAWRRVAGERRRLALVAMLLFWAALHAVAFASLRVTRLEGLQGASLALAGLMTIFAVLTIVATAFGLAVHGLFERRDLDLVFAAPVPMRTVWAARALAIATGVVALPAYFWLPFAHAAAWRGSPALLAGYPALAAFALLAASISLLATLALVRVAGPRRARVLAQVLGALVGAAIFLGFQARSFLPESWRGAFEAWRASDSGRVWLGDASPFWWPARALFGEVVPLAVLVALAGAAFAFAVGAAARAQARGALETISAGRERAGKAQGATARFGDSLVLAVLVKEWRLIARDPRAILHTLLPLLYLAPLLFAGFRRGETVTLMAPSAVVLAGFLAGGLAWLAASGEESPDLLASAPVAPSRLLWLKAASACLPAAAVGLPFVVAETLRPGGAPVVLALCLAGSIGGCSLVQILGAEPGARRDLSRGAQPGRWVSLVEHLGAAGWGLLCWGWLAGSAWGFGGLLVGLAAPLVAGVARPRPP